MARTRIAVTHWEDIPGERFDCYLERARQSGADAFAVGDSDVGAEFDGLILTGGLDVEPERYGDERHPKVKHTSGERDEFELAVLRRALDADLPVLAICRGHQLLNVALGGTLDQHLPRSVGGETHRALAGTFSKHEVRLAPGSLACTAAGMEGFVVWSHHHQGIERLGEGLKVSGRSPDDELVEAIELPGKRFALGVIWHPEEDEDSRLIGALVEAAKGAKREVMR